jgi:hypothetical protein
MWQMTCNHLERHFISLHSITLVPFGGFGRIWQGWEGRDGGGSWVRWEGHFARGRTYFPYWPGVDFDDEPFTFMAIGRSGSTRALEGGET